MWRKLTIAMIAFLGQKLICLPEVWRKLTIFMKAFLGKNLICLPEVFGCVDETLTIVMKAF